MASVVLLLAGFIAGQALRTAPPPLIIERQASPPAGLIAAQAGPTTRSMSALATSSARPDGPNGTANERPPDSHEVISICGARTKKGPPCSRRVRGTGRCWQHLGKKAILPPEKLIVQE